MGDNADQKSAKNVLGPSSHPSRPIISITPEIRDKVVWKIVGTLQRCTTTPKGLGSLESIARKFEEKIFAVASNEKDYLRKLAVKMHVIETCSERAVNSSPALSTSGGPNQVHTASTSSVHSENSKQDQLQSTSQNPATVQASGSKSTSQNSKLVNISKMPTEKKAAEQQLTHSNPLPVSLGQGQFQHSPKVPQGSNLRPSLELQQPQNVRTELPHPQQASEQPEKKAREQQITPSNPVPVSLGQGQIKNSPDVLQRSNLRPSLELQQPQNLRTQLPHPQQASGSHLRPSLELQQHQSVRPQLPHTQQASEQPEVSSTYRRQSVTKQQYESWQRDTAHQRKSALVQQKSMLGKYETGREQSSTLNNQQNSSQPNRAHIVLQQRPNDLANAHPQRSMAGSTRKEALKHQNVLPRNLPLAQARTQQKVEVVKEEKTHSSGVDSMLPRLETGVIPSRSMPSEASKKIDTSSAVETHKATHDWRDRIHERIMAMRRKYLPGISEMNALLDSKFKLLETHPNAPPNRDEVLKRLKESRSMILRIVRFLNIPLEDTMPVHGEKLEQWEQHIVNFISKYKRSKSGAPQTVQSQSLPPSQGVAPQQEHASLQGCSQLQKNAVASSSLPISRDVEISIQSQTQPPTSNLPMVVSNEARVNLTPIERLMKAVSSISPQAFKSGMEDIFSVAYLGDVMEPSAPRFTSNTGLLPIGQDLGAMTGCRLQARNLSLRHGGGNVDGAQTWTPRPRLIISNPYDMPSGTESTSENYSKRRRVEPPVKPLPEEIRNVNQRLIDIVVEICNEDVTGGSGSGTFVICRYTGVSVHSGFMKSILPTGQSSLIQSLRLLVPIEYPNCSPIILNKLPSENDDSCEDLSGKAIRRLDLQLRCLSNPFSVSEVARKWELCARGVVIEHAGKFGGGTFSSRYGKWENCC